MSKHYVAYGDGVKVYEGATPEEAKAKALRGMDRSRTSSEWWAFLRRVSGFDFTTRLSERLP